MIAGAQMLVCVGMGPTCSNYPLVGTRHELLVANRYAQKLRCSKIAATATMVLALDAIILASTTMYSLVSLSHIAQMCRSRHEFQVAVRSPVLAAVSGCSGMSMVSMSVFRFILEDEDYSSTWGLDLYLAPMLLTTYTGVYGMRGFRLLVMYNPAMRVRFGKLVKESWMVRTSLVSFAVLEIMIWSAAGIVGINRVHAYVTLVVVLSDILLTVGASLALFGKLRTTKDIFDMSLEIQKVGVFAMAALVLASVSVATSYPKYILILWMCVRFQPSLWFTNIQPVRATLQRGPAQENMAFISSLFPYIPWTKHGSSKVAAEAGHSFTSPVQSQSSGAGTVLDLIIQFPPMFQAFEEYCRNALCSESLMFLVDADEFNCSRHAMSKFTTSCADPRSCALAIHEREDPHFEQFAAIVDKYIREGSPFEVNIESTIRNEILREVDRARFRRLPLDEKDHLLDKATKQVSNMLMENLYHKFRETAQFKQIQEQLVSVEMQLEGA